MVEAVKQAARSLGAQVSIAEARPPTELESAFSTLHTDGVGAVLVLGGAAFYLKRKQIVGLALSNRLPSIFQNREFVEAGGLMSYAANTAANYTSLRR
jgi:putative ABC transport system substrate-binding protein